MGFMVEITDEEINMAKSNLHSSCPLYYALCKELNQDWDMAHILSSINYTLRIIEFVNHKRETVKFNFSKPLGEYLNRLNNYQAMETGVIKFHLDQKIISYNNFPRRKFLLKEVNE